MHWYTMADYIQHRPSIGLGTLAANTTKKEVAPLNIKEDYESYSFKAFVTIKDKVANQGPIYFGLADDILTNAQIAAYYNQGGPLDPSDITGDEEVDRPIMCLGVFDGSETGHGMLYGGRGQMGAIWQRFGRTWSDESGMAFHVYNNDDAALTGNARVDAFVRWKGEWR